MSADGFRDTDSSSVAVPPVEQSEPTAHWSFTVYVIVALVSLAANTYCSVAMATFTSSTEPRSVSAPVALADDVEPLYANEPSVVNTYMTHRKIATYSSIQIPQANRKCIAQRA